MGFNARILADSISDHPDYRPVRLTTFEVTFPRIVLAEFNTHRVLSRNSASSRAIPVEKNIERILADPFVPAAFEANKKGMQGGEVLDAAAQGESRYLWMKACQEAISNARLLASQGVHKHWANRLIEPYSWHTCIVTATEWENFFNLRCHRDAAPEIRTIAEMMRELMRHCEPRPVKPMEWHLPFVYTLDRRMIDPQDAADAKQHSTTEHPDGVVEVLVKCSVARCARVSYLTHDTGKRDVTADISRYSSLVGSGHMSPTEHAARVDVRFINETYDARVGPPKDRARTNDGEEFCGNFRRPWIQHRKQLAGEAVFRG